MLRPDYREIIRWLVGFDAFRINSIPVAADQSCKFAMSEMIWATDDPYIKVIGCPPSCRPPLSLSLLTTINYEAAHDYSCFQRCICFKCEAVGQGGHVSQGQLLEGYMGE